MGANVVLGERCELVSHVVLDGHTSVGADTRVFSFACLGIAPQDLKYAGEPTRLTIGARTVIRESVTISRGTAGGGGETTVGDDCLIMAYTHIGHDSHIGNGCILANAATLAGHVIVEDFASVGALCPVHQFCRIGRYSYIGGGTTITQGRAAVLADIDRAQQSRLRPEQGGPRAPRLHTGAAAAAASRVPPLEGVEAEHQRKR